MVPKVKIMLQICGATFAYLFVALQLELSEMRIGYISNGGNKTL
jgi:hypothetical protein